MRIKKIYFNRMYDQWRGEPLYVEDGLDDDKLYIRIMDVPDYKEGAINTITADYKDLNDGTYTILGQMDFDKRLAIFKIPLSILSNSGIYEVVFSLSFNAKDKEGLLLKTPIQTFEIVDTIESDDEAIAQDPNYPILVDLINQLAEYKVDTSIFPTREEMMKTIEENLNKTSMEEILKEVQANGYITLDKLNTILRNYASKADLSGYAKESDLNKFVTNLKFIQELDKYVLKTSMGNYVLKETGKGLSTHDLTDELYEKLVNLDMSNGEVNIDLTDYQKQTDDRLTTTDKTIVGSINEIKNSIPTKTSQLQNDSGYLTEHQDLSDYATKSELHNHDNKDILDNVTQEKMDSWDNKSDFSGSYNDLTDKPIIPTIPDIPTKVSQLENDSNYATESFVTDKIIEADLGGNIDLSEYAKTSDIPTKVSQLENDSRYVNRTYAENLISIDVRNFLLENTFIDCLNKIVSSFISDTIVFGNYVKYFYILRGRIRNISDNVDLPITIDNKEYNNVSYISMINTEYNILTTFIFSDEGTLRIETPYTPILDDVDVYIGMTITEIGNVHELKGSSNEEITECHTHTNKDILDTITSTMINNWNNKSDVTINDDINNISTTQTYSNSMIENRLTEVGADITVISDDLDSIDARVTYLEDEQTKMGSFDGSYDSLTNKPTIPTKTSELTNDSGFTTKKYVDDSLPHYNETLMFEISGEDYNSLKNNSYFNMSALNIDETKSYIGKINIDIEYTFKFVYNKEADALMDEVNQMYIYNHKSYNGTNFIEDENSAVITNMIATFGTGGVTEEEANGYFRLYEIDKVELDNNCLPDNVSIPNTLTVGVRKGDIGEYSVAEGNEVIASGEDSHAEGEGTEATGNVSHAEGAYTIASGNVSHAEGGYTTASGDFSHAEGENTTASGENSHAEGGSFNSINYVISNFSPSTSNDVILTAWNTNKFSLAKGEASHVEGKDNLALGNYSHAEGASTTASGTSSHAEGTGTTASGNLSHAEGEGTTASGYASHAEGCDTKASSDYQHVQGQYNIEDTENRYLHIVGNGSSDTERSNAHTLDWQGNGWYKGKLSQDGIPTEDKDLTTKKYVDDKTEILPVKNNYIIFEDAVPRLMEDTANTYIIGGEFKDYIFDSLQNEDMIIPAIKFNLNVTFNDGTNDITKDLILEGDGNGNGFYEGNDIVAVINYYKTEHSICMNIIEPNEYITYDILRATLSCDAYSNLLQNHLIQNIDYNKIEDVPSILSSIANGENYTLQDKEYHNLYDNLFIWDTNKFNERLDKNSGVKQNLTNGQVIQVKQKDNEGIGFGQHIPVDSSENIYIVANAGADVIIKVYNSTTKELIDTLEYFDNIGYKTLILNSYFLNGATSIFLAFTVKDSVTNFYGNTYISDLIVHYGSSFLTKGELLTKANTKEYHPTGDYHPATKKYVDDNNYYTYPTILYDDSQLPLGYVDITTLESTKVYKIPKGTLDSTLKKIPLKAPNDDGTWFMVDDGSNNIGWGGYNDTTITVFAKSNTNIMIYMNSINGYSKLLSIKKTDGVWGLNQSKVNVLATGNTQEYTPTGDYNPSTKKYVDDKVAGINASTITGLSTVATSGDYNDLTNKPTIPSEYTLPTASATQLGGVKIGAGLSITNGVLSANGGGTADSVDWSNVQNRPTIPSKVSQLTNDSGFITSIPSEYITETELEAKGYLTEHQNISGKVDKVDGKGLSTNDLTNTLKANYDTAYTHSQSTHAPSNAQKNSDITKAEIEAKLTGNITTHTHSQYLTSIPNEYITETELNAKGYLTEHQSLDGLATETYVNTKVSELVDSAPETLDTLKELSTALGDDPNFATTVSNQIGNKVDKVDGKSLVLDTEIAKIHSHDNKTILDGITSTNISNWNSAYTHSTSVHAPSNAQKNSDITKAEIEAKLTGNITTHTHSQYLTSIPSEYITETELNDKGYATEDFVTETVNNASISGGYTHPETHPASMITGLSTVATSGSYNDLTNKPTIPSIEGLATETYVNNKVAGLVDSAPEALNTLNELATALGNDANFATTISNQIGSKVDKVDGKSLVLDTEIAKIHEHGNKDLLDTIEADNVHAHSNKSVIDAITSDMTTKWNKSIPFENTYVSDCDTWLTNGYTKTSTSTTHHPSVCTGADRWGVLFYISENAQNGTGTQMYFPIDGTYAGRIFTRKIVNRSAGAWNLVSTFNGSYNDLTDKPTIPSEYTLPTASADTLGGIKVGAGLSINDGVLSANGGGTADSVDWSNVQNRPTKLSQFTNDSGFISSIPSEYITETELNAKGYLTEHQNISGKVDKVNGKGLSTNDLTDDLKANYDSAYEHSQSAHAPSNAQKNSDITKAEIEAKLTGNITTHTHSQYLTEHQSLDGYVKTTDLSTVATSGNYNDLSNKPTIPSAYTHPSTHPASMITGLSKVATSGSYNDLSNKPTIPTIPDSLPANGGNADTVNNFRIWSGTQAQFDAIRTKDANTIYLIKEG